MSADSNRIVFHSICVVCHQRCVGSVDWVGKEGPFCAEHCPSFLTSEQSKLLGERLMKTIDMAMAADELPALKMLRDMRRKDNADPA